MRRRLGPIGLASFRAAVVACFVACAAYAAPDRIGDWLLFGTAAAVGCAAAALQTHPWRGLGLVPVGTTGLAVALTWAACLDSPLPWGLLLLLGFFAGVAGAVPRVLYDARCGKSPSSLWLNAALDTAGAAGLLCLFGASDLGWWAAGFAVVAATAWVLLFVPTLELFVEFAFWPMYRIRARGPGAGRIPRRGPLLIVANHTAYADPFWLAKVVPRRVTPMMTSRFYDLPVIRWLMVHIVGAIRVPAVAFRREAPELRDAVAVLRRGGCLLVFPEGRLRNEDGPVLRPFGQGVWHVLRELPDTPVVVCWIEGGWGSFASYRGGPPFRGKGLDWRRPIDVAVAEPRPLDPAVLTDQRLTRLHLRQTCLEARRWLGLPPLEEGTKQEDPEGDGDEKAAPEADPHQINP